MNPAWVNACTALILAGVLFIDCCLKLFTICIYRLDSESKLQCCCWHMKWKLKHASGLCNHRSNFSALYQLLINKPQAQSLKVIGTFSSFTSLDTAVSLIRVRSSDTEASHGSTQYLTWLGCFLLKNETKNEIKFYIQSLPVLFIFNIYLSGIKSAFRYADVNPEEFPRD